MSLTTLPKSERPRERLQTFGPQALSLQELLAILLETGTKEASVLTLASALLTRFSTIKRLLEASIEELMEIKGIGQAKAIKLKAVFALALRYFEAKDEKHEITKPEDVYERIKPLFYHRKEEVLMIFLRDIKGHLFHEETIAIGTLSEVLMHPREIFFPAIRHKAYSFIVAHNHPSGDPTPSQSDIALTRLLATSANLLAIRLDDHLIIGEKAFTSLWKEGVISRANY